MAGDDDGPDNDGNKSCKYCKKNVVTTVIKCSICESVFHPSCALRVAGLVVIGSNYLVKCCAQYSEVMSTAQPFVNDLLSAKDQLVKSKDRIISELKEKEAILMDNINLLKEKIMNIQKPTVAVNSGNVVTKTSAETVANSSSNKPALTEQLQVPNLILKSHNQNKNKPNLNSRNQNVIEKKGVNSGILQAQASLKMQELINLVADPHSACNNDDWQTVHGRKKGRKFMVGNNKTTNGIQTIPRYVSLHISRLAPDTRPAVLQSILQPIFKDVKCEEHISKHPEVYGSMKVTIRKEELQKAWKREIWPNAGDGDSLSNKSTTPSFGSSRQRNGGSGEDSNDIGEGEVGGEGSDIDEGSGEDSNKSTTPSFGSSR
ncbi:unnamed protein product [Brassicogethes aeneus]|uniref:Uncharacterized protein n=1 Tax=Brassicogethes aeneus TaxID=1431903 RepID=A0A9P0FMK5_BRAAE|nr:unnamed protein product [Brassicogethes aeneus]